MAILGDLEHQIMSVLWDSDSALSVREVHLELLRTRDLAYTTVMTVLDRLAKKQLVLRQLDGRAWRYRPALTASALVGAEMLSVLAEAGNRQDAALQAFAAGLDADQVGVLRAALCRSDSQPH